LNLERRTNDKRTEEIWVRRIGADEEGLPVCFATSFRIGGERLDLRSFARTLPEGIAICNPDLIAGIKHVETILIQTREYWKRNERIAKNGSIEILMRLTGRSQISEAVEASGVNEMRAVAMFGLVSSEAVLSNMVERFSSAFETAVIDHHLLELSPSKSKRLKKFHRLPGSISDRELQIALGEKSVLLIFSR